MKQTLRIAATPDTIHIGIPNESLINAETLSYRKVAELMKKRGSFSSVLIYSTELSSRDWNQLCKSVRRVQVKEVRVVLPLSNAKWKAQDVSNANKESVAFFLSHVTSIERVCLPYSYLKYASVYQTMAQMTRLKSVRLQVCSNDTPLDLHQLNHLNEFDLVVYSFRDQLVDLTHWFQSLSALKSLRTLKLHFLARVAVFLDREEVQDLSFCLDALQNLSALHINVPTILKNHDDWHILQRTIHNHVHLEDLQCHLRILEDDAFAVRANEYFETVSTYNHLLAHGKCSSIKYTHAHKRLVVTSNRII